MYLKIILFFGLIIVTKYSFSQTNIVYGKPTEQDINIKEYAIDKSAPAIILFDYTKVSFEYEYSQSKYIIEKQVRLKILHTNGIEKGNVEIPFIGESNFEDVEKISGVTINISDAGKQEISEISKTNIYKETNKKYSSSIKIAFPNVKVGSIIDYKYKVTRESLFSIPTIYIQQTIPVVQSIIVFDFPEFLNVKHTFVGIEKAKKTETITDKYLTFKTGGRSQFRGINTQYLYQDVLPLKEEPHMHGTLRNYWKRIESQVEAIVIPGEVPETFNDTWGLVGLTMLKNKYFWGQIDKDLKAKIIIEEANKIKNLTERANFLINHIKTNIIWNKQFALGSKDVIKAYENKVGHSGDLNLMLVALLRKANIQAFPILCATNDYGIINIKTPDINEFNYSMVALIVDDKTYIVDATEKYTPMSLIPEKIMTTTFMSIQGNSARLLTAWDGEDIKKQNIAINAEVDKNGKLIGTAFLKSYGYERVNRLTTLLENKKEFEEKYILSKTIPFKIINLETTNQDINSDVLEQKVDFELISTSTGEYYYFNPNIFLNLEPNPFINETRNTAINFVTINQNKIFAKITIPDNLNIEGYPETKTFINSDSTIILERKVTLSNNELFYTFHIQFNRPLFEPQEYPELKELYKKMYAMLEEQIVLKKK